MSSIAQKLKENIDCLQIVLTNTTGIYTPAQIEAIKKWHGWGFCKAILYGDNRNEGWETASVEDKKLLPALEGLYELLQNELTGKEYKRAIESMKSAVLTSFYTPKVIPRMFYEVLSKYTAVESMYEPSAGCGVFVTEAVGRLSLNDGVTCYEKDILTGKVLQAIVSDMSNIYVWVKGFEESGQGTGDIDLICSNIPFGAIPVYDTSLPKEVTTKIHNYFFAKGLEKLREGGILAYLVTSAFLDTVTNSAARKYLFERADFISLTVMPDNLMKETGNTEAPSHFLVVRKNSKKTEMSEEEKLLCVSENMNAAGVMVSCNKYIYAHMQDIRIGEGKIGKNQYGKPSWELWWDKPIDEIAEPFRQILERDFRQRYQLPEPKEGRVENGQIVDGPIYIDLMTGKKINETTDEMPPWEELPKHIQIPEGKMIWEDEIVDIPAEFDEDDENVPPTYTDEEAEHWHREWEKEHPNANDEHLSVGEETIVYNPANEQSVHEEPVKKLSKREQQIIDSYIEVRDAFVALEQEKI